MLKKTAQIANRILLVISTTVLALMMLLISIDVIMRYLFNAPVPGAFELTEYLMAILIPFSIAYCGELKGHVAVDLVYEKLSKKAQWILDVFTTLVSIVLVAFLVWQGYRYIFEVKDSGLTSSVLLIPTYPFVIPISIGMAVFALVMLVQLLELRRVSKKVEIGDVYEVRKSEVPKG